MKKTKKIIVALVTTAITLSGVIGLTSSAQTDKRSANIKSKGIIDFQNGAAVISSSDLNYLADEIDLLEDTYKTETVNALNQVGTFYKLDGTTTFNPEESTLASSDASILPFSAITDGIINSQSIPAERTYLGTLPGGTEMNGNISAATAENLSLGTAAWVDGELIVGTGADNNSYYDQGQENSINNFDVIFYSKATTSTYTFTENDVKYKKILLVGCVYNFNSNSNRMTISFGGNVNIKDVESFQNGISSSENGGSMLRISAVEDKIEPGKYVSHNLWYSGIFVIIGIR